MNKNKPSKKKRVRALLITLGCCCLIAAASLAVYNYIDESRAGAASEALTAKLDTLITTGALTKSEEESLPVDSDLLLDETESTEEVNEGIDVVYVSGYKICGVISIPDISVELAVIGDWSYPNLTAAPCRYSGTPEGQMILLAHNYSRHFGKISELEPDDTVTFTDIDGNEYNYKVTGTETWATNQLREIISGDSWDLTLFTCTYGGANRVVVRCSRVD